MNYNTRIIAYKADHANKVKDVANAKKAYLDARNVYQNMRTELLDHTVQFKNDLVTAFSTSLTNNLKDVVSEEYNLSLPSPDLPDIIPSPDLSPPPSPYLSPLPSSSLSHSLHSSSQSSPTQHFSMDMTDEEFESVMYDINLII